MLVFLSKAYVRNQKKKTINGFLLLKYNKDYIYFYNLKNACLKYIWKGMKSFIFSLQKCKLLK